MRKFRSYLSYCVRTATRTMPPVQRLQSYGEGKIREMKASFPPPLSRAPYQESSHKALSAHPPFRGTYRASNALPHASILSAPREIEKKGGAEDWQGAGRGAPQYIRAPLQPPLRLTILKSDRAPTWSPQFDGAIQLSKSSSTIIVQIKNASLAL